MPFFINAYFRHPRSYLCNFVPLSHTHAHAHTSTTTNSPRTEQSHTGMQGLSVKSFRKVHIVTVLGKFVLSKFYVETSRLNRDKIYKLCIFLEEIDPTFLVLRTPNPTIVIVVVIVKISQIRIYVYFVFEF